MLARAIASLAAPVRAPASPYGSNREATLDILRGFAIVFMALDHVRDFLSDATFQPENLALTTPAFFFTRWTTHFCAPLFFFAAGAGAYLMLRACSRKEVERFLLSRGLWLVVVELTIVWFAWTFMLPGHLAGVLWALGVSMMILALLIRLPLRWVAVIAGIVIAGHDLLDPVKASSLGAFGWCWVLLHGHGFIVIPLINWPTIVLFPIIPLVAVMAAGYAFGRVFEAEPGRRIRTTLILGICATAAFVVLRGFNLYGNPTAALAATSPGAWHPQATLAMSVVAFLDIEKYPSSLQFLLMTLGPSLVLLAALDRLGCRLKPPPILQPIMTFGQVPLFFYVLHLFAIHIVAIVLYAAIHEPTAWLLHGGFFWNHQPRGTGLPLAGIWMVWIVVVIALYFPCAWYAGAKSRRHNWWLKYL